MEISLNVITNGVNSASASLNSLQSTIDNIQQSINSINAGSAGSFKPIISSADSLAGSLDNHLNPSLAAIGEMLGHMTDGIISAMDNMSQNAQGNTENVIAALDQMDKNAESDAANIVKSINSIGESFRKLPEETEKTFDGIGKTIAGFASNPTRGIKSSISGLLGNLGLSAGAAMGWTAGIAAVGAVAVNVAGQINEFNAQMRNMGRSAGMSRPQVEALADSIKDMSSSYGSLVERGKAVNTIMQAGWDTRYVIDATKAVTQFSKLTGSAVGEVAKTLNTLSGAFGKSQMSVSQWSDSLWTAFNMVDKATNTTFGEFTDMLNRVSDTARKAGMSMEDTAAVVASLQATGSTPREITSAFNELVKSGTAGGSAIEKAYAGMSAEAKKYLDDIRKLQSEGGKLTSDFGKTQEELGTQFGILWDKIISGISKIFSTETAFGSWLTGVVKDMNDSLDRAGNFRQSVNSTLNTARAGGMSDQQEIEALRNIAKELARIDNARSKPSTATEGSLAESTHLRSLAAALNEIEKMNREQLQARIESRGQLTADTAAKAAELMSEAFKPFLEAAKKAADKLKQDEAADAAAEAEKLRRQTEAAEAARAYAAQLKSLKENLDAQINPLARLTEEYSMLEKAYGRGAEYISMNAEAIVKAAEAAREHGVVLTGNAAAVAENAQKQYDATEATKKYNKELEELIAQVEKGMGDGLDAILRQYKMLEEAANKGEASPKFSENFAYQNAAAIDKWGKSMEAAGRAMDESSARAVNLARLELERAKNADERARSEQKELAVAAMLTAEKDKAKELEDTLRRVVFAMGGGMDVAAEMFAADLLKLEEAVKAGRIQVTPLIQSLIDMARAAADATQANKDLERVRQQLNSRQDQAARFVADQARASQIGDTKAYEQLLRDNSGAIDRLYEMMRAMGEEISPEFRALVDEVKRAGNAMKGNTEALKHLEGSINTIASAIGSGDWLGAMKAGVGLFEDIRGGKGLKELFTGGVDGAGGWLDFSKGTGTADGAFWGKGGAASSIGSTLSGISKQMDGVAGTIMGMAGGALQGAVLGMQLGAMLGPIGAGLGAAIGAAAGGIMAGIGAIGDWLTKNPFEKAIKDQTRDLGVALSENDMKKWAESIGLSKDDLQRNRAEINRSPQLLLELYNQARQTGKLTTFLDALENGRRGGYAIGGANYNAREELERSLVTRDWQQFNRNWREEWIDGKGTALSDEDIRALQVNGRSALEAAQAMYQLYKQVKDTGAGISEMTAYLEENRQILDSYADENKYFSGLLDQIDAVAENVKRFASELKALESMQSGFTKIKDSLGQFQNSLSMYEAFLERGVISDRLRQQIEAFGGSLSEFEQAGHLIKLSNRLEELRRQFLETGVVTDEIRQVFGQFGGDLSKLASAESIGKLNDMQASLSRFMSMLQSAVKETSGLDRVMEGIWDSETIRRLAEEGLNPALFEGITKLIDATKQFDNAVNSFHQQGQLTAGLISEETLNAINAAELTSEQLDRVLDLYKNTAPTMTEAGRVIANALRQYGGAEGNAAADMLASGFQGISDDLLNTVRQNMQGAYQDEARGLLDYISSQQGIVSGQLDDLALQTNDAFDVVSGNIQAAFAQMSTGVIESIDAILSKIGEVRNAFIFMGGADVAGNIQNIIAGTDVDYGLIQPQPSDRERPQPNLPPYYGAAVNVTLTGNTVYGVEDLRELVTQAVRQAVQDGGFAGVLATA